jgi:aspartate racemase
MEEDFYKGRLVRNYGLKVMVPDSGERDIINRVIYEELCRGKIVSSSKKAYVEIMDRLVDQGAQGIILGCTEIGLLVNQEDNPMSMFDTAKIHAEAAVEFALKPV